VELIFFLLGGGQGGGLLTALTGDGFFVFNLSRRAGAFLRPLSQRVRFEGKKRGGGCFIQKKCVAKIDFHFFFVLTPPPLTAPSTL
jgi:hypothetical protein